MLSCKFLLLAALALVSLVSAEEIDFTGRYKMTVSDSDNYNALLKELDIGYFKRLAATNSNSEYVITQDKAAGTYTLQSITTFADSSVTFESGVTFKEARADGQTVDSTITIEGNKWTHVQAGNPTVTIERTFNGKVMM
uniref:Allergen Aca s 13 n=1 Tax=Acarus siro TaxID=66546 RepID=B0KZJ8_ACASI|nr:allergen Aca s 13 [Acarus siro]